MPKNSMRKMTPIPPALTATANGREAHVRMGRSLLASGAVRSLSPGAFQTYVYMIEAASGKATFIYPAKLYEKVCSRDAFARRKKELIAKGFISVVEDWSHVAGKATVYALSTGWKQKSKP